MALRRYSVTQVDSEGYDWYTLHTDSLEDAIAEQRRQRENGQATVYIYDNVREEIVKNAHVHPTFRGIFDSFLIDCVNDTVNNGDTLQVEREYDRTLERESLEDRGWKAEGAAMIPCVDKLDFPEED